MAGKACAKLANDVHAGTLKLGRACRIVRDRIAQDNKIEQARVAAELAPVRIEMRSGRFQDVLADLPDVDAIITDPPYEQKALPLLRDLALWADKVLKPDGVMAVLYGQTYLPEALLQLAGGRPYRWTACYLTDGHRSFISHLRNIQCDWKPLPVYGGNKPHFPDVIRASYDDAAKHRHRWGQRINHLPTSRGAPAHMLATTKEHPAGTGGVTVAVKLPKTMHVDGFPVEAFAISVTPDQPCAVSVNNRTRHLFDVTLTSLNGGALTAGSLSVLVIG